MKKITVIFGVSSYHNYHYVSVRVMLEEKYIVNGFSKEFKNLLSSYLTKKAKMKKLNLEYNKITFCLNNKDYEILAFLVKYFRIRKTIINHLLKVIENDKLFNEKINELKRKIIIEKLK